jgi:hypothetical protein
MEHGTASSGHRQHSVASEDSAAKHDQTPAHRVSIQDLEGDCSRTALVAMPRDLEFLKREVSNRFDYKSGTCIIFTREGAPVDDIALIRDNDVLFASDSTPFPQLLRQSSLPGLEKVAVQCTPLAEQYYMWGWPRIGQLVGGEAVRAKLLRGWQTSGVLASVLLVINYFAFISPPPDVSGLALATPSTLRAHFWLAGLATIAAMFSLVLAVLLSMQMNLLPREEDVFYFLQHYGTWLFGSPTVMVVVALMCTGGQLVSSSALHYPSMESDTWCLLAVVVLFSLGGSWLFVSTSSRCWRRVNSASITKVFPGDPWMPPAAIPTRIPGPASSAATSTDADLRRLLR